MRFSIQWVKTVRWTLAILTFCEKLDGNVVERSCFTSAELEDMEAVPLMLGMVCACGLLVLYIISMDVVAVPVNPQFPLSLLWLVLLWGCVVASALQEERILVHLPPKISMARKRPPATFPFPRFLLVGETSTLLFFDAKSEREKKKRTKELGRERESCWTKSLGILLFSIANANGLTFDDRPTSRYTYNTTGLT